MYFGIFTLLWSPEIEVESFIFGRIPLDQISFRKRLFVRYSAKPSRFCKKVELEKTITPLCENSTRFLLYYIYLVYVKYIPLSTEMSGPLRLQIITLLQ